MAIEGTKTIEVWPENVFGALRGTVGLMCFCIQLVVVVIENGSKLDLVIFLVALYDLWYAVAM